MLRKFDLNTDNDGASAKASPFHALIVLGKNDCPYWLVVWPICLNFMVFFSSSTLIHINKDTFEGHLCQTVNNFVKQIKGFFSFSYQERLSNLKMYSLQSRSIKRGIVIYVWKILENLVSNLVKPLQFYVSDRRGHLCSVSHVRLGHTGSFAYSSFRWKGIRMCLIHCQCTSETSLHAPFSLQETARSPSITYFGLLLYSKF